MSSGSLRSLRELNRMRVVDALRHSGTASRADLSRHTGLSRATVSSLVSDLIERGVVMERSPGADSAGTAQAGRPPVLLALDPSAGAALGIDFGHTHVRVAVADLSSRVLAERRHALDVDSSAGEAIDVASALADEVLGEAGVAPEALIGCGMGVPGPIDRTSGIVGSSAILPGWAGLRPADELARRLAIPVEADNDANLGTLAEAAYGAARSVGDVIYVKVASGIGAGVLLGGRLHRGATGIAGEIGHVLVDPQGRLCRCGSRGCLETVAAAPALLELLRDTRGAELTLGDVVRLARDGDVGTRRLVADSGRAVGRVLADLCNVLNPELLVLGGELAVAGDPLIDGVRESLARFALPAAADAVRVTAGVLGDRAELLGALALVIADTDRLRSKDLPALGGVGEAFNQPAIPVHGRRTQ
jgi:predicted NBD/HSP70 family sugar kinase